MHEQLQAVAPHADAIAATVEDRRHATQLIATNYEHIPAELVAHLIRAAPACDAIPLLEHARRWDWNLDAEKIICPVRIVWEAGDALLPWPSAAARFRDDWLPHAD